MQNGAGLKTSLAKPVESQSPMTFSRNFQLGAMVVCVCAVAWIWYENRTTNDLIGDANALVVEATDLSRIAKERNEALATLSTNDVIKNRRAELQAAAQETDEALRNVAAKWREVAELNDRLVGRTENDVNKRLCRMRRDSFLALAEASEANAEASLVWLDPKIVDQRSGFIAREPYIQRAEAARERADNLKAEAKALRASQ